ncbi:MAG TPA: cytochrome c-type biogenesis protein CcmH [Solirubrobacteraceae bacterium]|nr:cytochrome c-type biogenesis protein CcmH [Solirubrobacteraceae bacterium]
MRARALTALAAAMLALGLGAANAVAALSPKDQTSYIQVVDDVMCVVCHEPLAVAQSPEAFQERDYIRQLIAQGKTRKEIENDLVTQYGPAVLARPPASGVNVLVYIVPPLVLLLGLATLAVFVPKWRRRARQGEAEHPEPAASGLDPADAQRLNEDLGRFA